MTGEILAELARKYPAEARDSLLSLAQSYEKRREQDLLEIAAIASEVSAETILAAIADDSLDPLVRRAIEESAGNKLAEHGWDGLDNYLRAMEPSAFDGFVQTVKGKVFEIQVVDRLNAGDQVGDIALGAGQQAILAKSPIQKGWDVMIVDSQGPVEVLSMKATQGLAPIKRAIERYPDIDIVTTSDNIVDADFLYKTDISESELADLTRSEMEEFAESAFTNALEATGDFLVGSVPIIPAVIVLVTEGRAVLAGRSDLEKSLGRAAQRMKRPLVMSILHSVMLAADAGAISVPVTVTGHVVWTRLEQRKLLAKMLGPRHHQMVQLREMMNVA